MPNVPYKAARHLQVLMLTFAGLITSTAVAAQDYILLRKGGGVTGNTTVFRISSFGEVAKGQGIAEQSFSEFSRLRKWKTKKYFRKTRALLREHSFNNPGNVHTSIALEEGGKEMKIVWGDAAHQPPKEAVKLYQKIHGSLNRLTFSKELRK
jgi:hypothetical protein